MTIMNELGAFKPLSAGEVIGPYQITARVPGGVGGSATVYKARTYDNQYVALKVAHADKGAILRDDASFIKALKLQHPHIIKILATPLGGNMSEYVVRDPKRDVWYFAMEYMAGGSLGDWMQKRRRLPPGVAIEIVRQIGSALDTVHAAGGLHLDVKPNNILFREDPQKASRFHAVLTDFGISRLRGPGMGGGGLISSLTVEYASPEQARSVQQYMSPEHTWADGQLPVEVGPGSDLYSLATILYEMVAGHLPFPIPQQTDGTAELAYLHKLVYEPVPLPIPGTPPMLNQILATALSKDPALRYPNAGMMITDLDASLPTSVLRRSSAKAQPVTHSPVWVGLTGLVVGLVVGFASGMTLRSGGSVPGSVTVTPPFAAITTPSVIPYLTVPGQTPAMDYTPGSPTRPTATIGVHPTSTRRPTDTPVPYVPPPVATPTR